MNLAAFLILILLSLIFLHLNFLWLSALCLLALAVMVIFSIGEKSVKVSAVIAKSQIEDIYKDMEKTEPEMPSLEKAAGEAFAETGKKAGELVWAPESHRWGSKKLSGRMGQGAKNLIKTFKELFK